VDLRRSIKGVTKFLKSLLRVVDTISELVHVLISCVCRLALLLGFEFDKC
jgi:hypothetical protein